VTEQPYDPGAGSAAAEPGGQTRSLGDIVGDISKDLSALVRQEMDLAKTELKQEITKTGKGAGMLGAAGVAGLLTLVFLSLALTYLLDNWMPVELAALIVALLWGAAAAVLGVRGRNQVQQANPQLPTTQHTLKEDVQWAKAQKS
jgi:uncharacterized membrane protein YqjE